MGRVGMVGRVGSVLSVVFVLLVGYLEAGCQKAGVAICCQGRNNTCVGDGARLRDANSTQCFCDSACMEIGDCCVDYTTTCPTVDCVLSDDWSEWSVCSSRCGTGVSERTRRVVIEAKNGGQPCGQSRQKVSCDGEQCKHPRTASGARELKERGNIIPAQFASWRRSKKYDPFKDIRKNLFEHYVVPVEDRPSYSAEYRVTDVHSSCNTSSIPWPKRLVKGASLCVECQHFSMKKELGGRCAGHGVLHKTTEWKAVAIPGCHGKWTMTSRHRQGRSCDPADDSSFVFV